jgi:hypothetical protein
MRIYLNPLKSKRNNGKKSNQKKNTTPLSCTYHKSISGEKIKFIPCSEEHLVEVKKRIK